MKNINVYLIILLIAIIIFACCNNQVIFEGFEQSDHDQIEFDKACIESCQKKEMDKGNTEHNDLCTKECNEFTESCKYYKFNSLKYWECLQNINPNIIIPQHIKDKFYKKEEKESSGIRRSEIPVGDENLYILKSQIVPPVCPACPPCPTIDCGECKTDCQPCPPCARCPEPSFECKKVPNYKSSASNPYLPIPWLNSFSQFS